MEFDVSWDSIPSHVLRAVLDKRETSPDRPACGSGKTGTYNTSIHVGALILVLLVSTASCAFPIVVKRFPKFPVPHHVLFLSKHFGTGVLIATAFVHLFPTAYTSLTHPCLHPFWTKKYPAMAGLISMLSVFIVVGVEMFFALRGVSHSHGSEFDTIPQDDDEQNYTPNSRHGKRSVNFRRSVDYIPDPHGASDNLLADHSPSIPTTSPQPPITVKFEPNTEEPVKESDTDSVENLDVELNEIHSSIHHINHAHQSSRMHNSSEGIKPDQKALLQCLLLEAGILFHSIFIGMALSVTPAPPFYVLIIAITFHQTFEGLALGSRISALAFHPRSLKPWLMALAFGTTTPIGQAIGLGIHTLYDPNSEAGLLSVGIMNAISSGLLIFAGLVNLLASDFLSEESFATLKGKRRMQACFSVIAGALGMALVGAWA